MSEQSSTAVMDLLKTPSVQSLVDSDIGSVESLQSIDIEELDEAEYALPAPESTPSLAELLREEGGAAPEPADCSSLQAEQLHAITQQLSSAQERSAAGAATTLTVGAGGRLAVGTAHGHLLAFQSQVLRWACDSNSERGAVSCLAYNGDSTRLLAGYARGLICQFESSRGIALRRVVPGGGVWGALRVAWAAEAALALDTGGSVWLLKFSRPLGVRSARVSCLFSGARGEVVAMAPRDARVLALATLSRVIAVAGGRAAAVRLTGPPETLPVLAWCECEERVLVCARGSTLQWHAVNVGETSVSLRTVRRAELASPPLWLGWLGGRLAVLDAAERLRLWEDDDGGALDLAGFHLVYATAFFKGVWTDGRVSQALSRAGAGALGGACSAEGALTVLGSAGVVRVRPRDAPSRARALAAAGRPARALRLLAAARSDEARRLAAAFVGELAGRPGALRERDVAVAAVRLCINNSLHDVLWGQLWESGSAESAFVEAVGLAAAEGLLAGAAAPAPDVAQALLERLAEVAPDTLERVIVALPLTSLDPHCASVLVRSRGLWRAAAALAGVLGGTGAALRDLAPLVQRCRAGGAGAEGAGCACAGDALLVCAADGLGGRGAGGARLAEHARPAARRDTLVALLAAEAEGPPPLRRLLAHDARSVLRLLEMSARDPPFAGPLGKQNRLRVARALLEWAGDLEEEDQLEVIKFVSGQLNSGTLPPDRELTQATRDLAVALRGERADRAWLALLERPHTRGDLHAQLDAAAHRPRVRWHLLDLLQRHHEVPDEAFALQPPSETDVDEIFEYLSRRAADDLEERLRPHLRRLVEARPRAAAALLAQCWPALVAPALEAASGEPALLFAESLIGTEAFAGDVAATHLRNLCVHNPNGVVEFLKSNPVSVGAEDAIRIVREHGPRSAEPTCLEAAGDAEAAVRAAVALAEEALDRDERAERVRAACELCARAAAAAPAEAAARMWARLLASEAAAGAVPPGALLEAAAHVPVDALVERACAASPQLAIALCECAAGRAEATRLAARILDRELHAKLARSVRAAGRALAVRSARCVACGAALAGRAARAWPCGHAAHVDCCAGAGRCAACGARVAGEVRSVSRAAPARAPPPPFELQLTAPPQPDLEGLV